jgi:hypothetical protein
MRIASIESFLLIPGMEVARLLPYSGCLAYRSLRRRKGIAKLDLRQVNAERKLWRR